MTPLASNLAVTIIDLIPLIVGGITYRLHDRGMRILFYFFIIILGFNGLNIALKVLGHNNLWVLHLYTLAEYGFLSIAIGTWLGENWRKRILLSIVVFVAVWIWLKLSIEDLRHFDSLSFGMECLLLLVLSCVVLVRLVSSGSSLLSDHRFYAVMGLVLYFSGTTTLFALRNIFYSWQMHSGVALLASLIWSRSFWCLRSSRKLN